MKNTIFFQKPKITGLFAVILMMGIIYGCEQSSNPFSSHELDGIQMEAPLMLSQILDGEVRITSSGTASHINPAIDGNRIVWQDNRNNNYSIFLYNVLSGTESQITNNPNNQTHPAIAGSKIVWSDDRSMDSKDIFMYDLATSTETQISDSPEPYNDIVPKVSGNRIIWETFRWTIYAYDLNSSATQTVGYEHSPKTGYDISGNLVVLSEYDGFSQNVRLYNFLTDSYTEISFNQNYNSTHPSIDGNRIVWQDNRNGNWDIYFYDLSTSIETQITSNSSDQTRPVISGNYIVWVDERDGNENIYYYDLVTKAEHQVTNSSAAQINPDISGNRIVWQDNRDGNWNIYYYEIKSAASSTSGFTNGAGFIDSPKGAIMNDVNKSGRAQFRLNARVKKDGQLQGTAVFKFANGNIDFQSTSLNRVFIVENTAIVTGTGRINGSGAYHFYINVVEEQSKGRNKVADKYRIRLVDSATQQVVYDNQMGDPVDAKATHPITNGKILVKADK
ncbi:MAG: hypothetical protein LAT57_10690 [Balneolales bacterium]|nr:hypothetical protein [Balneolales bacterium]